MPLNKNQAEGVNGTLVESVLSIVESPAVNCAVMLCAASAVPAISLPSAQNALAVRGPIARETATTKIAPYALRVAVS
ncbi:MULTISPECIES: hypothetical protein [Methylomonas]|uniref:Uncharacterized protein n=1 Tax=Methylomonas koyamae TaxID=702114 RepID=A0A177NJ39_9GAMM|nr:hypothetical protein [Methylomonas koyamae]OAI17443.1 hypothetical protein A1355_07295 [Methylomonas koyamae]